MTTRRKSLAPIAFPCGDGAHSTFVLGVRVHSTGFVELTGLIRMPYSNRPKVGGGIAVPYRALNVNTDDSKPIGPIFKALRVKVRATIDGKQAYIAGRGGRLGHMP